MIPTAIYQAKTAPATNRDSTIIAIFFDANAQGFVAKYTQMAEKKFIEDRKQLEKLAPMLKAPINRQVFVCTGKSCTAVGSAEVKAEFARILEEKGLRQGKESKGRNPLGEVLLTECGSIGFCSIGTAVMVYPDGTLYGQVTAADVPEIIEKHIRNGNVVRRLALMELPCSNEK
jgi:(2Fe-2S) ferredoxin